MKKGHYIIITLLLFLLSVALPFVSFNHARADTAQPSSVSIHDISIYNSLINTGDFLAVVPYTISYTSVPSDAVNKTFLFELIDTDGATLLGSITAYPFANSGYGEGIVSFYFSANNTLTWGAAYNVKVAESPAFFTSPTYWTFPVASSYYSAYTSNQTANRTLLQTEIVNRAQHLTTAWGISSTPLTQQSGSGIILSSYGEAYFRNAIYGLQQMCPSLFLLQSSNLDYTGRSWDYSLATTLLGTFSGTWVGDAMTGFAGLWGVPTTTATSFVILFLALVAMGVSIWISEGQHIQAAFLDGALVLIFGALGGWFSPIINILLAFMFVLVGGWILLLNKA